MRLPGQGVSGWGRPRGLWKCGLHCPRATGKEKAHPWKAFITPLWSDSGIQQADYKPLTLITVASVNTCAPELKSAAPPTSQSKLFFLVIIY